MPSGNSPPRNVKRKGSTRRRAPSHLPPVQSQETHNQALQSIRHFLKQRSAYDLLPVSFRVIVLDTELEVKKGLECMVMNSVVSASLWNSRTGKFAGMFTVLDIIHLIQYYYKTSSYQTASIDAESIRFDALRAIEKSLDVPPPPLLSIHPLRPLLEACRMLIETHARRLPLIDRDTVTGKESLVSVLTQYRLLRFIARNCQSQISQLHMGLRRLKIGTYVEQRPDDPYFPIATARMDTTVFDVVHMFSERGISAVPIIDENGVVVNLYETVDVISLVSDGAYQNLDLTIASALNKRSPDFPGVIVCTENDSLATLLSLLRQRRVHRLVVVEGDPSSASVATSPSSSSLQMAAMTASESTTDASAQEPAQKVPGRLLGIITLSDVLRHIVGDAPATSAVEPSSSVPATTPAAEQPPPPSIVEPEPEPEPAP